MKKRMYRRGRRLTLNGLTDAVIGGDYVFFFDRPCHPSWVVSMRLRTLAWHCRRGDFRTAARNR